MMLSPTYKKEVEEVIKNMDPRKSCGYDGILPGVVKYLATELSVPLDYIINLTFLTGNIPKSLKTSTVVPIYKSGDSQILNSYRTMPLIPCFSKILGKIMYKRLINYINNIGVLTKNQYGFRKKSLNKFSSYRACW